MRISKWKHALATQFFGKFKPKNDIFGVAKFLFKKSFFRVNFLKRKFGG
jgi:hypothetical protein